MCVAAEGHPSTAAWCKEGCAEQCVVWQGMLGAVTGSRRVLLMYFGLLMVLSCVLLYAAVLRCGAHAGPGDPAGDRVVVLQWPADGDAYGNKNAAARWVCNLPFQL